MAACESQVVDVSKIAQATEAELDGIRNLTRALRQAFEREDRPRYFEINQAIHAAILKAARSDALLKTHATIAGRIHRARYQANLTPSRWETAVAEHERISGALILRDAALVNTMLHDHMMAKLVAILSGMQARDAPAGPEAPP